MIVASCGGFPKDMSLYQGTKTIDNIEFGLKRGGTLVLLIEAATAAAPRSISTGSATGQTERWRRACASISRCPATFSF